jgi:hypothetical protein
MSAVQGAVTPTPYTRFVVIRSLEMEMRRSGPTSIEHRATGIVSVVMLALAVASPMAMPATVASPLRDAWKLAAIF